MEVLIKMDEILLLLAKLDAEDCMDVTLIFHMREYCVIKSQSHYPDTTTYM